LWEFFGSLSKVPRKVNGFSGKPLENVRKTQKSPVKIQIIKNSIKIYKNLEFFEKFPIDGARKKRKKFKIVIPTHQNHKKIPKKHITHTSNQKNTS
jgi:hypothetical protein